MSDKRQNIYAGSTAPTFSTDVIWRDTSVTPNILRIYNTSTSTWVSISSIGTLDTANNGLSASGVNVSLGQSIGAGGNPAQLVSDREIPMNGFNLNFNGSSQIIQILSTGIISSSAGTSDMIDYTGSINGVLTGIRVTNNNTGTISGAAVTLQNSSLDGAQIYLGSSGNSTLSRAMALRNSGGTGGIIISADSGDILFSKANSILSDSASSQYGRFVNSSQNFIIGTTVDSDSRLKVVNNITGSATSTTVYVNPVWNTTGAPTALKVNPQVIASAAASLLMDVQYSGTSKFNIRQDGKVTFSGTNQTLVIDPVNGFVTMTRLSDNSDVEFGGAGYINVVNLNANQQASISAINDAFNSLDIEMQGSSSGNYASISSSQVIQLGSISYVNLTGKQYVGATGVSPTAYMHFVAGTATAGTAPIKLTSGTNLTTPEDGALEYGSGHLYFTIGSTRYQLDQSTTTLTAWNGITLDSSKIAWGQTVGEVGNPATLLVNREIPMNARNFTFKNMDSSSVIFQDDNTGRYSGTITINNESIELDDNSGLISALLSSQGYASLQLTDYFGNSPGIDMFTNNYYAVYSITPSDVTSGIANISNAGVRFDVRRGGAPLTGTVIEVMGLYLTTRTTTSTFASAIITDYPQSGSSVSLLPYYSSSGATMQIAQYGQGATYNNSSLIASALSSVANNVLEVLALTWNTTASPTLIKGNVVTYTTAGASTKLMDLQVGSTSKFTVTITGALGIQQSSPTAWMHLPGVTTAASSAPIKLTSGTLMTTAEDGAFEYASSHLYFTIGSTRYQLDGAISGSGTSGKVAYFNGSASLTSDTNFSYVTSNNGTLSIGTTNTQGHLNLGGNKNLSSTGAQSYFATATYTDTTTGSGGTSSTFGINYISGPTIAATNTSVTFPTIMTLLIDPPTAGTNATITNAWALMTGTGGNVRIGGLLQTDGNIVATAGYSTRVTNINTNATLTTNVQLVKIDASSGNVTITLPSAGSTTVWNGSINTGLVYKFIRTDASINTVTIAASSGENINGNASFTISGQYTINEITAVGVTAWLITQ